MAHYYVVRQKLDKTGAEDKVRYYGVPVTCGRVSTKKLADLVADRCSLSHRVKARRVCFRMAPCVRKSMKFVKFERNPW